MMAHLRTWLFTNLRVAADGNRLFDQENQCWQQFDSTGGPFGEHVVETYIYYFDAQARPGANTLFLSFWYRCPHVNSSSVNGAFFRICQLRSKNDQPLLDLGIDLNRQTWWWARYTSSSASTLVDWGQEGALIEGEWHHVELKIVADPTSGGCELRVDGEVQWSTFTVATTYGSLVAPYLDRVRFEDDAGNTPRHRFRHLVLWDDQGSSFNSWLGELRDAALRPTADIAAADWTPSSGSSHWDLLDEYGFQGADYVESSTVGHLDRYALEDLPADAARILLVELGAMTCRYGGGPRAVRAVLHDGVAQINGATHTPAPGGLAEDVRTVLATNPNTGLAWTVSEVNACTIGLEVIS